MEKHYNCEIHCQLQTHGLISPCADECELLLEERANNYWRNMSWQERQGWMRARDEECD